MEVHGLNLAASIVLFVKTGGEKKKKVGRRGTPPSLELKL